MQGPRIGEDGRGRHPLAHRRRVASEVVVSESKEVQAAREAVCDAGERWTIDVDGDWSLDNYPAMIAALDAYAAAVREDERARALEEAARASEEVSAEVTRKMSAARTVTEQKKYAAIVAGSELVGGRIRALAAKGGAK
jgi:hypothetical protein